MCPYDNKRVCAYVFWLLAVWGVRLLPFRPPNVEPVFATLMPLSQRFGMGSSFVFGALSMVLYDAMTSGLGVWTLVTGFLYGILGIGSHYYLRRRKDSTSAYVCCSIVGTLAYDAATGLTIGPLVWGQPFAAAFAGQIPFTLVHLASNVTLAIILSPILYRLMARRTGAVVVPLRTHPAH